MLILTRKQGEEIVINDDIVVTLVSCGNGRARLGVQAPQHVSIDRGEIHQRKMEFVDVKLDSSIGSTLTRLMSNPGIRDRREAFALKSR